MSLYPRKVSAVLFENLLDLNGPPLYLLEEGDVFSVSFTWLLELPDINEGYSVKGELTSFHSLCLMFRMDDGLRLSLV